MKWIRTSNGDKAHVVLTGAESTLCGIGLEHVAGIVIPGPDNRCENCDHLWLERGQAEIRHWRILQQRQQRQAGRPPPVYSPRYQFSDWEREHETRLRRS